jgi:hypothetical protein
MDPVVNIGGRRAEPRRFRDARDRRRPTDCRPIP